MRCIVTGGSGFIGFNLLAEIVKTGCFDEIISLDLMPLPHPLPGVRELIADLCNSASFATALADRDTVIHLAAASNVDNLGGPQIAIEQNILATANLLEVCRKAGIARFVMASTVWVYTGSPSDVLLEESEIYPCATMNLYSATKISAELLCKTYEHQHNMPCTILRFETPYGPHMRKDLAVYRLVNEALHGRPLTLANGGAQTRHFIHISDLVRGIRLAACLPIAKGGIYNLPGPRAVSIRELAETIFTVLGVSPNIVTVDGRAGDCAGRAVSLDRAHRELGWMPTLDIKDGIGQLIDWLKTNADDDI